jgi:hypothetical protein
VLELDPDFLAAHALRDRLLAEADAPAPPVPTPAADGSATPASAPGVSADGYARFQQRTRQRRLEKRIEAARDAIRRGRIGDAAAALDEVIELDPKLPELFTLTEAFDTLRRTAPTHRGPWFAAAAVFACTLFGGSWLQDSSSLLSRPVMTAGVLLPMAPPAVKVSMDVAAVGTSGAHDAIETPTADSDVAAEPADMPRAAEPPASPRAPVELSELPLQLPASVAQTAPRPQESPVVAPIPTATPFRTEIVDDSALVHKALQRYRLAYEDLDAQSAQAVWPAVNQTALARAFDGLESQTLTFDACDVRISGETAAATCQGSARYVPKIGSREPRVEPRVWNFTLRKNGNDWKIDSARAER